MNKVTYGIRVADGIISKIIRNFPILNLIYTKKVQLEVHLRTEEGRPISGIFHYERIPRWWMKIVPLKIALLDNSDHTLVYIKDCGNKNRWIAENACNYTRFYARTWAYINMLRNDV